MPETTTNAALFDALNTRQYNDWYPVIDFTRELSILFKAMGGNESKISREAFSLNAGRFGFVADDFKNYFDKDEDGDSNNLSKSEFCQFVSMAGKDICRNNFNKACRGIVESSAIDDVNKAIAAEFKLPVFRKTPSYAEIAQLADDHLLTINNKKTGKIDVSKLVVILTNEEKGKNAKETADRKDENRDLRDYKFGVAEIGDGNGAPLSINLDTLTTYDQFQAFMEEIRNLYLEGEKFQSIHVDSHGSADGWVGAKDDSGFNVFKSIGLVGNKETKNDAPFYEQTQHLNLDSCLIFSNLDAEDIEKLRGAAKNYNVRIDANTTLGWMNWGFDAHGYAYDDAAKGPGGNAFAFISNGSIKKILKPGDKGTYKDTIQGKYTFNRSELEKVWRAQWQDPAVNPNGSLTEADFTIDDRKAPNEITYGVKRQKTLVYQK